MSQDTSEQRWFPAILSARRAESAGTQTQPLAYLISALLIGVLGIYHWHYEGWRENIIFAGSITAALIAALMFATRRLVLSLAVVTAVVFAIVIASDVKRRYMEMVLHAYDVVFYLTSWATIRFLWVDHRLYLIAIAVWFLFTACLAVTLYKWDKTRVSRVLSGGLVIIFSCLALWASHAKGERRNLMFYWDNMYLSSFYASWSETLDTLLRGQLLESLQSQKKPLFKIPAACTPNEKPPHILLIHQESVVAPFQFPQIDYDRALDPFFRSFDGKVHKLRVETYGGASWLTEFSVLAGVSTYSFGGMRTFVQSLMQGKIHDTLPQALTRCGYDNAVFYPVPKDFVSNGRFYAATGMPKIFDFKAQGAKNFNERDKFYYANVLKNLKSHVETSAHPVFNFIITSATHLPYNYTYDPSVNVPGGGPGTDPEMHEYLRRLGMAKMDFDWFRQQLQEQFPNERFLIVQYGDHQPVATRTYLGFDKSYSAEDMKLDPDSPGFITYYSVDGVNYTPPPLPDVDTLEVPYLGTVLLESARLPLSPAYAERQRLLALCDGRYYTCSHKREILGFHRRLIDSGLVEAR